MSKNCNCNNYNEQLLGLKRNTIDKYYTKDNITKLCLQIINENLKINYEDDLIIEPSAGNGSFIKVIKQLCGNYKLFDLEPDNDEIIQQDFLNLDYSQLIAYTRIHIIGNPPFGRQSSLAIKFIRYASLFCDSISFILPKSFKKDSLRNKIPLCFHLLNETDLPKNSFLVNNTEYDVPCVFQIWEKKETKRLPPSNILPKKFKFVKKNELHDISFRRVGVNAGNIATETEDKSIQSHYFIKFDNFDNELFNKLKEVVFNNSNNTVGPKSISKPDVVNIYNNIL